jgi:clan AA aspartic protease
MITGIVKSDEGRVRLRVKGTRGREQEVDAVIDTGFTGALTLPSLVVAALGLRWQTTDLATLGDGSQVVFDLYEAKVVWDGRVRQILVDEANGDPLLGMQLLRGHKLTMDIRPNGKITIKRLPRR